MSILIKGMEMPKACYECRMYESDIYYCAAAERDIDIPDSSEGRCTFCPLVPVPPHGRLIDGDAVTTFREYQYKYPNGTEFYMKIPDIKGIPTIIPADKGGEG